MELIHHIRWRAVHLLVVLIGAMFKMVLLNRKLVGFGFYSELQKKGTLSKVLHQIQTQRLVITITQEVETFRF